MPRPRSEPAEEIIESEMTNDSDAPREVRVYKGGDEDFILTIPPGARMTFGYFNPGGGNYETDRYNKRPSDVARATALRIYADSTDKRQIACFLGVSGFRDLTQVGLVKVVQKVTVETRLDADGEGNDEFSRKQTRQLLAAPEVTPW